MKTGNIIAYNLIFIYIMKYIKSNKQKFLMTFIIMLLAFVALIKPQGTLADSYSNNDEDKTISIDKKIRSIKDDIYVDNIPSTTRIFYQNDVIEFKIKVTNTGDVDLKNITVVDNLPPFLKLIFYPGTYDSVNNKIEWKIDSLNAGDSQRFLIRAKIDKAQYVNVITKETNVATVSVDGDVQKDDAIYYIGGRSGVTIPDTGSMDLIIQTGVIVSLGFVGLAIRKKIRGY